MLAFYSSGRDLRRLDAAGTAKSPALCEKTSASPVKNLCWQDGLGSSRREKHAFLKNKAGELLKTKDEPEKQTGNKAETNLANLLKTLETPKKQSENKPENKAGHLIEKKASRKNKPETNRKRFETLPERLKVASLPPVSRVFSPQQKTCSANPLTVKNART